MGCGGSKRLDPELEGIPEKIRPFLRRRYEEIKKRRGIHVAPTDTTTLSKKELLCKEHASDEETEPVFVDDDDQRSDVSSQEESLRIAPEPDFKSNLSHDEDTIKTMELSSPSPHDEEELKESPKPESVLSSPSCNSQHEHDETDQNQRNDEVLAPPMDENQGNEHLVGERSIPLSPPCCFLDANEEIEHVEEEVVFAFSGPRSLLPPSSPSFRVYLPSTSCRMDEKLEENGIDGKNDDSDNDSIHMEEEQSKGDSGNENVESVESNEDTVNNVSKRRWKRGKKLKRVISMAKTSGMTNMLHVNSCYPSCSRNQSALLLEQKAAF